MKATRRQFLSELAKHKGATFEEDYYQQGQIMVDAPDGYLWNDSDATVLVGCWWTEFKGSKAELYADLIDRMKYGLCKIIDYEDTI